MSTRIRLFTADDQLAFARLSGDYNPIHMDPVAARRLLFGRPVVHGMHTLLWALDAWLEGTLAPLRLKRLKAKFRSSIPLNVAVELATHAKSSNEVQLELLSEEVKVASVTAVFASSSPERGTGTAPSTLKELPPCDPCRSRSAAELQSANGEFPLYLEPEAAIRLFPNAASLLPADQLAALLASTRVVGMEAPGLNSILAGLELQDSSAAPVSGRGAGLRYRTETYDERVSRLELHIEGPGFEGIVTSFVRPEPQGQMSFADLRSLVGAGEFQTERALVIGGSRGLGEVAVKLLAAGGAAVKLTYQRGAADADRVVSEVTALLGTASSFAYDVLTDAVQLPALAKTWSPTLLCYFATPFISGGAPRRFSFDRFQDFSRYYVDGFLDTFHAARALGSSLRNVVYPSSAFVEQLPLNMGEYAAAKAAAETVCRFLQKAHPEVRFHCPRLPRLATDQTATLIRTDLPDPTRALLAILRELRAT
ncbi:MAG TPA: SDR family NAD(P)-dependent oxidoreductase [Planctomycetaceae bacterium]|jgi:NAD(P)-dependent dehydrogenase (short-subunit alcohol dehydrogenase family)|nr:SDR family NAD(P)-dependent oxidoreductase [Planctomycetaceae bacterium]